MTRNAPMGMKKHGRSGYSGKSPKLRHYMKAEAEKNTIKTVKIKNPAKTMTELLKHG